MSDALFYKTSPARFGDTVAGQRASRRAQRLGGWSHSTLPCLVGALVALAAIFTVPGTAGAQEHKNFRVATYNIRHITDEDTGNWAWAKRQAGVQAMIREYEPDIFGTQESSDPIIWEALRDVFGDSYDYHQPVGSSPKLIFFRKARFEKLDPDQSGKFQLENPYSSNEDCFPNARGRTVGWVKLRDKETGRIYLVMNVHTAHAYACWKARNKSAEGIHQLIAEELKPGETPLLFGDFNMDEQRYPDSHPDDKMVSLLEETRAAYQLRRSARHTGKTGDSSYTFNSNWKTQRTTRVRLDYILIDARDLTTHRQMVDRRSVKDLLGSGADISPSDHYFVGTEIAQAPFHHLPVVSTQEGVTNDHISFGDVNGDGRVDLIRWKTDYESGRVRVHLAQPDGSFAPAGIIDDNPGEVGEYRFFADIDGDGCADRISWSPSIEDGKLRVGRSLCDGTFEADETASEGTDKKGTKWFFARLNDDECMDRIAWHPEEAGGQTRVALAKCDGSLEFHAETTTTDDGATTNPKATLAFVDADGDGLADKILWDLNRFNKRTTIFSSKGDGDFDFMVEALGGDSGVETTRFFYGDIDGDGYAEKLFWRPSFRQGFGQLYAGSADGFKRYPTLVNSGPSERESTDYFLADVNGDGSADLIRWDLKEDQHTVQVYLALVTKSGNGTEEPDPEQPDAGGTDDAQDLPDGSSPDAGNHDAANRDAGNEDPSVDGPGADNDASDSKDSTQLSGETGCGCTSADGPTPDIFLWLGLAGIIFRRRRR